MSLSDGCESSRPAYLEDQLSGLQRAHIPLPVRGYLQDHTHDYQSIFLKDYLESKDTWQRLVPDKNGTLPEPSVEIQFGDRSLKKIFQQLQGTRFPSHYLETDLIRIKGVLVMADFIARLGS